MGLHPREGQSSFGGRGFHGDLCGQGRRNHGVCPELLDHPLGNLFKYAPWLQQDQEFPFERHILTRSPHTWSILYVVGTFSSNRAEGLLPTPMCP